MSHTGTPREPSLGGAHERSTAASTGDFLVAASYMESSLLSRRRVAYEGATIHILARSLLVAAASVALTPSSQDLHNRYGELDVERFIVRPGSSLTVEYGSDP
jgi:hypothetical protein